MRTPSTQLKQQDAQGALAEALRRQRALYELVERRHRATSFDELHEAALDAILSALRCERASILLCDNAGIMRFVAWRGLSDRYRATTEGHTPWASDEPNPQPIHVPDLMAEPMDEGLKRVIIDEGIRALAFIPLVVNGKLSGKFMIYYDTPHEFTEDERSLSMTIGRQIALGLERKRAEEALVASEAQLRAELLAMNRLHELMTRLLSCKDLRSALNEALEAAMQLLSADMGNVQLLDPDTKSLVLVAQRGFGKEFLEFYHAVGEQDQTACSRALRTGQRVVVEDVQKDPSFEAAWPVARLERWHAVQSTPLVSHEGQTLGVLSTHWRRRHRPSDRELRILDLYVRQAANFMERTQKDMALREADRRKDEFLAMLGHELRNPLAPITTAAELMKVSGQVNDLQAEALEIIQRQSVHLTRLVDDLLDVSRITNGEVNLRSEALDLRSVVSEAIKSTHSLFQAKHHRLTTVMARQPLPVLGDATRLVQVFVNLLNNAAKYTPAGGRIEVEVQGSRDHVSIRVKDNGIGIDPAALSKVFDLFVQAGSSLARSEGGLGVGLTLVRRIVQLHGGEVSATSQGAGRGTEFIVRLPLAADRVVHEAERERPAAAEKRISALRILIVDDNLDAANSLGMLLQIDGHEIRIEHTGQRGLTAASEWQPDVVLLDIGLPDMGGYEVGRCMRQAGYAGTLIAVTGYGQEGDRASSAQAGFDDHLVKPVALETLKATIEKRMQVETSVEA